MVNVIFFYARLFLLYYLSRVIKKRRRRLRTTGFKEEMWISDEMKSFLCVCTFLSLSLSPFFSRDPYTYSMIGLDFVFPFVCALKCVASSIQAFTHPYVAYMFFLLLCRLPKSTQLDRDEIGEEGFLSMNGWLIDRYLFSILFPPSFSLSLLWAPFISLILTIVTHFVPRQ